jgi:glycine/sarcosine N-methyltransferase
MADDVKRFYDGLAADYHLIFEDWNASISRQSAALAAILERECGTPHAVRVLDCACGIGTQALGLASGGFRITGSDLSPSSIERACAEAEKRGLNIPLFVADMLDLTVIPDGDFDAVVCMDNALPHLDSPEALGEALTQIRRKLRSGAVFIASIRDYDRLVQERPAVQGPTFYTEEGKRRMVHQVWDWIDDRHYTVHLYITRQIHDGWETQHDVSNYRALLREELSHALQIAGFTKCRWLFEEESGFYQPIILATAQ